MISNSNLIMIQGNLVRDAEFNTDHGLITFSVAVDRAGNEKDSDNTTGYFDVKVWVTDSDYSAPATVKRIKSNFTDGKLAKGSRVSIIGRIQQERWPKAEGGTNSRIVIMAEDMMVMFSSDANKVPAGSVASASAAKSDFNIDSF